MSQLKTSDYNPCSMYHYNSELWRRVKKGIKKVNAKIVFTVLKLYFITIDPAVAARYKVIVLAMIIYIIFPIDLIPDTVLILGYSDDLAILLLILDVLKFAIPPHIERKALDRMKNLFDGVNEKDLK